jgi:predicted ATPase/DNA-binding CsgD family transcriptional regulator
MDTTTGQPDNIFQTVRKLAQNLPSHTTPLIGREQEVAEIQRLLNRAEVRLLTLTGPGGVGKTRLALQLSASNFTSFDDGVIFVSLAAVTDPALVPAALAQAIGLKETGGEMLVSLLQAHLRDKQMLLVLDNFEQITSAALLIKELLEAAPRLKILITSRTLLQVSGEYEFTVPPLALPDLKALPPLEQLAHNEAVALFVERAQMVRPDFALSQQNAATVAQICIRLDGLPLALELAAARIKLMPAQAILDRLNGVFGNTPLQFLTGGARDLPARQQTLRNTIDWSYGLLDPGEKTLFARFSAFVGGCTLEAAEAVLSLWPSHEQTAPVEVLDGLSSLLNKSMLQKIERVPDDLEPRFTMLEALGEYAREKLAGNNEAWQVRARHAGYYLRLAEEAERELKGARQVDWLTRLEVEHDNLRVALTWCLENKVPDAESSATPGYSPAEMALRFGAALWRFWQLHSHLSEGRRWLEQILAATAAQPAEQNKKLRARVLHGAGVLAFSQTDYKQSTAWLEQSLALGRELNDKEGIILALQHLGLGALYQGEAERAIKLFEEVLELRRELKDNRGIALTLNDLGNAAHTKGDLERASKLLAESLDLFRQLGNKEGSAIVLGSQGHLAYEEGHFEQSKNLFVDSLRLFYELGSKAGIAQILDGLAGVAAEAGLPEQAVQLWGATEVLRETIGAPRPPLNQTQYEENLKRVQARLDQSAFSEAWATGRAQTPEEVIDYAAGIQIQEAERKPLMPAQLPEPLPASVPTALPKATESSYLDNLTNRELEVLELLAEGLSNAQIAEKLFIAPRTVNVHLTSIYSKLDVNSRTAAARIAIERGLIRLGRK